MPIDRDNDAERIARIEHVIRTIESAQRRTPAAQSDAERILESLVRHRRQQRRLLATAKKAWMDRKRRSSKKDR